jgi:predicted dithiol-disulfide oxidoreductase (DUF899 family)
MSLPDVATRAQWLKARKALLAREKEFTRQKDALNAERRRLPMVAVEKDYTFEGPEGAVSLADLFDGQRQLVIYHFMFDPSWDDGCSACTAGCDELSPGLLEHLGARSTAYAVVARAPYEKIAAYKEKRGWTFPFFSSNGSDFNYDFHATIDEAVAPAEYNYRTKAEWERSDLPFELKGEWPGRSSFLREGDRVFHTYSVYARGTETIGGSYYMLDETALGRQEDWEEPKGRAAAVRGAKPDFAS